MAISATHYELLTRLKPHLPARGTLLEIGEANWYGDTTLGELLPVVDGDTVIGYSLPGSKHVIDLFAVAKWFYKHLFAPSRIVSVDMNGTPVAWKCDLNYPLPPLGSFDVVINHGTAEHIFNIAQVFASIHAACKVGGLMVHESPFTGWLDHGFYCLQPTLFYDLAAANGYELVGVNIEHIESRGIIEVDDREHMTQLLNAGVQDNSMLYVAMRKTSAEGFRVPMQGYYAQTLSDAGRKAWSELR